MRFEGKTALVTGGSRGIGRACVAQLVGEGATVAFLYHTNQAAAESLIDAARLGLGLIQAPRYHLEADIAAGTLVTVLDAYAPTPSPVSLLYPRSRRLSPRVRVFIDWAAGLFSTS